jgi:RimJ/RimL family protein N-acetyltransferase
MDWVAVSEQTLELLLGWFRDGELRRRLGPPTPGWIRSVTGNPDASGWLALENGTPVGFVQMERQQRTGTILFAVRPDLRRQGVGRRLLIEFTKQPALTSIDRLEAYVEPDHAASRRCLAAAGFTLTSAAPNPDGFLQYEWRRGSPASAPST